MKEPLRVYIAGASKEPERVRHWMRAVEAAGMQITLDWLALIESVGKANEGLTHADREQYASADWRAVREADVVWLLAPTTVSSGAWVELGLAFGCGNAHVIVSGPGRHACIFAALAEEYETDAEAFEAINRFAGGRARGEAWQPWHEPAECEP